MFKCKVCSEKELRIAELKEQIQYFKTLLNPPPRISKYELEETAVMNGGGEELDPATIEAEEKQAAETQREVDFIFNMHDEMVQ